MAGSKNRIVSTTLLTLVIIVPSAIIPLLLSNTLIVKSQLPLCLNLTKVNDSLAVVTSNHSPILEDFTIYSLDIRIADTLDYKKICIIGEDNTNNDFNLEKDKKEVVDGRIIIEPTEPLKFKYLQINIHGINIYEKLLYCNNFKLYLSTDNDKVPEELRACKRPWSIFCMRDVALSTIAIAAILLYFIIAQLDTISRWLVKRVKRLRKYFIKDSSDEISSGEIPGFN